MPFSPASHEPRLDEPLLSVGRGGLGLGARGARSLPARATSRMAWMLRLLVCHLLPLCSLLTFFAGSAAALPVGADLPVDAPMCDPAGASVAAVVDIPEVDRGHFEALPCEAQLWIIGGRQDGARGNPFGSHRFGGHHFSDNGAQLSDKAPPPPRELQPSRGRYDGTCELLLAFPVRSEPLVAPPPPFEGLAPRRGHTSVVYRPPVTRA